MRFPNGRWRTASLLTVLAVVAAAQDSGSIAGRVTNSVTGAPVVRAHVSLTHWGRDSHSYGALTDDKGKYSIARLPAGQYSFTTEAAGFEPPRATPDDRTDTLELGAGEHRRDFDIALTPWSSISGRVMDAEGRPVQGVEVAALGLDGFLAYQTSDPTGAYYLSRLSPGRYRVRAAPEALHIAPEIRTDGTSEIRYASTYYPEALTPQSATPLDLPPGEERTGIDIRLVRAPIVAVRGTVSGIEPGIDVSLSVRKVEPPRGPNTGRGAFGYADHVNPDGSFVVWGLNAGTYLFVGQSNAAGWESAPVEVTVAGKDVNGIQIALMRQVSISGQVVLAEGAGLPQIAADASLGQQKQISLHELMGDEQAFSVVANDGSFHFDRVSPGRYSVPLSWGPYVQSMRLGSTGIAGDILDLRNLSDPGALTVTASSTSGEIAGVVRNGAGPVAHARVALVKEGRRDWIWVIGADSEGRYSFANLEPGTYQVVALDGRPVYASALRFLLFDYADVVENVDLAAGDRVTRDLRRHDGK